MLTESITCDSQDLSSGRNQFLLTELEMALRSLDRAAAAADASRRTHMLKRAREACETVERLLRTDEPCISAHDRSAVVHKLMKVRARMPA